MNGAVLEDAVQLAKRGWPVFPLRREGKEPLPGTRGFKDATTDPDRVKAWEWSEANIGIRTGTPANLLVVDVDPRHDGDHGLYELEWAYGRLPQSVEAKTGGGGRHLYLRCSQPIPSRPNALGPGVDVKAATAMSSPLHRFIPAARPTNGT
jgi:putative DNA primase/helicase